MSQGIADDCGLTTEAELLESEFYREQLLPLEIRHSLGFCVWSGNGGQFATITLSRDMRRGYFERDELALAARILPHVKNVYRLQQQLGWTNNILRGFRAALDYLNMGVVLLDRTGRILHMNDAVVQLAGTTLGMGSVGL
jgi:PAS domain-containing protein